MDRPAGRRPPSPCSETRRSTGRAGGGLRHPRCDVLAAPRRRTTRPAWRESRFGPATAAAAAPARRARQPDGWRAATKGTAPPARAAARRRGAVGPAAVGRAGIEPVSRPPRFAGQSSWTADRDRRRTRRRAASSRADRPSARTRARRSDRSTPPVPRVQAAVPTRRFCHRRRGLRRAAACHRARCGRAPSSQTIRQAAAARVRRTR